MVNKSYTKLSWGLSLAVFIIGIFSTITVTAGDSSGRVNLMYLILLYVIWPLLSLLMLVVWSLVNKKPVVIDLISGFAIWPRQWRESLFELKRERLFNPWLFCQSQKLMLAFNTGCIGSFITILLFNDLSFVWRSTLLDAGHIHPILSAIALPWFFIDAAQPIFELLVNTQHSRLIDNPASSVDYGSWWKFLIAAQLCYGIIPRILLLIWASYRFKRQLIQHDRNEQDHVAPLINRQPPPGQLAAIVEGNVKLDSFSLVVWADLSANLLQQVKRQVGQPEQRFDAGPHGNIEQELAAERDQRLKLVVVAAWEPPLGELMDFLQHGHGYLMPLDWSGETFRQVSPLHLDEWRRFCYKLDKWQLLQPKDLI